MFYGVVGFCVGGVCLVGGGLGGGGGGEGGGRGRGRESRDIEQV